MKKGDYWKRRCALAEDYIDKSPCDPDIYPEQLEAYRKWKDCVKEQINPSEKEEK